MKLPSFIFLSMLLVACKPPTPESTYSSEQIVEEVTQMLHEYHQAMEQRGFLSEFEYLDQSSDFFWVPPGFHSALDYDSVATILKANDKVVENISLKWDSLRVLPLRHDLAQYYGTIHSSMTDTAQVTVGGLLIETGLIIKREDGWKLLNGQSAFIPSE